MPNSLPKIIDLESASVPARDREDVWAAAIYELFGPGDLSFDRSVEFSGSMTFRCRDAVHVGRYAHTGFHHERGLRHLGQPRERFFLSCPTAGRKLATIEGTQRIIQPGHLYLIENTLPGHSVTHDYASRGLIFDSSGLRRRTANTQTFFMISQQSDPARCNLLMSFVEHFIDVAKHWTPREFAQITEQLLDLVVLLMVEPQGFKAESDTSVRAAHRERALRYIRDHLSDPDLSPQSIADACGISLRYLYKVFRNWPSPVEEYVLRERLMHARRMLAGQQHRHLPVNVVANRAGFRDPSHFSRAFKAQFGEAPREFRSRSNQE